jgi:hypothetical protein
LIKWWVAQEHNKNNMSCPLCRYVAHYEEQEYIKMICVAVTWLEYKSSRKGNRLIRLWSKRFKQSGLQTRMIDVLYAQEFIPQPRETSVKIDPPRWTPLEYPVQNAEALA